MTEHNDIPAYAPMADLVVVQVPEVPKKIGSIIVPGSAQPEEPMQGEVFYRGPLVTDVKEGDLVVFRKFTGEWLDQAHRLRVMQEEEILGVVVDDGEAAE